MVTFSMRKGKAANSGTSQKTCQTKYKSVTLGIWGKGDVRSYS